MIRQVRAFQVLFLLMLVAGSGSAAAEEPLPAVPVAEAKSPEPEAAAARTGSAADSIPPASGKNDPLAKELAPFGLYMDARLGLGGLTVRDGTEHENMVVSGITVPLELSAGVSLTRALVVFGEISDIHMLLFNSGASYDATGLDLYGAGLGLKYYLTPGIFLSGSGSIARLRLQHQGNDTENSRWGAMARVSLGGEWPVSPKWSVGVGSEYQFGVVQSRWIDLGLSDDKLAGRYSPSGLSLLVLASYHQPAEPASGSTEVASAPSAPPAGYHTHDGLYLGASLGPGWLWVRNRRGDDLEAAPDTEWSGRGTFFTLSVGYAFADRLVVFGEFSETQVRDPAGESGLASVEWRGFGPGLRYYLMRANVFFSGALLLSNLAMYPGFSSRSFSQRTSDWGATGQVSLGKEWWLLSELGIGVAAELAFGKMAGNDPWLTYTVKELSLLASVSFN